MSRSTRVAIIGAGISGISAAKTLLSYPDIEFKIFEATGRIGGRIWTNYLQDKEGHDYKLEYGANWIHGIDGNPIHTIATENQLYSPLQHGGKIPESSRYQVLNRMEDGSIIPDDINSYVQELFQSTEEEAAYNLSTKPRNSEAYNDSVGEFLNCRVMEGINQKYGKDEASIEMATGVLRSLLALDCSLNGCDSVMNLSLSQYGTYQELSGREPVITQGYDKVVHSISKDIPSHNILLNSPVSRISYNLNSKQKHPVCITYTDGLTYDADVVIATPSLGYLKSNYHVFSPPLPKEKLQAINNLGIGTVDKIFLQFQNLDFLSKEVSLIHIGLSESSLNKSHTAATWYNKIFGFIVEGTPEENTLATWITGQAANQMELLTDAEVAERCVGVLRRVLNNPDIPLPQGVIRSSWFSNPYTKGSYSHIPTGASADDIKALSTPIYNSSSQKPVVLLAGEATHCQYFSTTHGAYLSGQKQAQCVIDAYSAATSKL